MDNKAAQDISAFSYEKAIRELEKIISKMEKGNLSLEETMRLYEQGISLSLLCQENISSAKLKFEEISSNIQEKHNEI